MREVIVDHDDVLAVVLDMRVTLFNDQWAEQAAVELESNMAMIEVRPRRFGTERVREALPGCDRFLRNVGDAVPVNRRLLLEVVYQFGAEYVTLLNA